MGGESKRDSCVWWWCDLSGGGEKKKKKKNFAGENTKTWKKFKIVNFFSVANRMFIKKLLLVGWLLPKRGNFAKQTK
jgi:hypothetical protein